MIASIPDHCLLLPFYETLIIVGLGWSFFLSFASIKFFYVAPDFQ